MPQSNVKAFNVDNVRVVKVLGSNIFESRVVKGMLFNREPEGCVKKASKAKIAVFSCPIDISRTETKGTVLIHNANEMMNFSKGEEQLIEQQIKEIASSGVTVVVTGATIGEMSLHFLNRYNLLAVRVQSKFDLRRLCKVVGATPLARLGKPMEEEMGHCDLVEVEEIGSDRCTVFKQLQEETQTVSIVLRGATLNMLDDLERAIEDGVNVVKSLTKVRILLSRRTLRLFLGLAQSKWSFPGSLRSFHRQ
jgi:T-complex protein 1 subunit theta